MLNNTFKPVRHFYVRKEFVAAATTVFFSLTILKLNLLFSL